jgi:molybdenum cofactor cytidylyltransferase
MVQEFNQTGSAIIATAYPDGGGVPAIFDKSVFPQLLKLDADRGARQLIRNHEGVVLVPPAEQQIRDIDTPEDYQKLLGDQ